jgi:hypothetical protein
MLQCLLLSDYIKSIWGDYSAPTESCFDPWPLIVIKELELAAFVHC